MKTCWHRFNHYLLAAMLLGLLGGCQSPEHKRKGALASLRVHLEVNPDASGRTEVATVHEDPLVRLTLDKTPALTDAYVQSAKVVDVVGGYALSIQFERQGTWLLEELTAANQGRHLAIFCQFPDPPEYKLNHGRWVAAPKISTHIADGRLVFAPDATRAEADLIALGLNHVAKKLGNEKGERSFEDK